MRSPDHRRTPLSIRLGVTLAAILLAATTLHAKDESWPRYKDPEDGKFDMSGSLLDRQGFLPVPNVITEPAVGGFGLGVALAFFHGKKHEGGTLTEEQIEEAERRPPSVSAVAGMYTANDSWMIGGGHFGSWKQDRIRYSGALGYASINLDYYVGEQPLGFNIEGVFLLQEGLARIRKSNWFAGGRFTYLNNKVKFDFEQEIPYVEDDAFDSADSGLGAVLMYDSRDNIFTPDRGQHARIQFTAYDEAIGGDFDYRALDLTATTYHTLGDGIVLGAHFKGDVSNGDPPFYALPYIHLRGVAALRYQGLRSGSLEVEGRFRVAGRWIRGVVRVSIHVTPIRG